MTVLAGGAEATQVSSADYVTPIGPLTLFASADGLVTIALPNEAPASAILRLERRLGPIALAGECPLLREARAQLAAYFDGALRAFDLPLAPHGSPFQRAVWAAVATIAYGATVAYRDIARAIDRPAAVRAVGLANGANPLPIVIPCHRVIGANGALTGYGGGLTVKRALLALERGQPALL
jgi:methylated-DNA-[protein]-cysteine S-methyltransferase